MAANALHLYYAVSTHFLESMNSARCPAEASAITLWPGRVTQLRVQVVTVDAVCSHTQHRYSWPKPGDVAIVVRSTTASLDGRPLESRNTSAFLRRTIL